MGREQINGHHGDEDSGFSKQEVQLFTEGRRGGSVLWEAGESEGLGRLLEIGKEEAQESANILWAERGLREAGLVRYSKPLCAPLCLSSSRPAGLKC